MKYYIDTEFIERGHEHPIELISLAMVREDGVSRDYVFSDGWQEEHANAWVKANVLPHLKHQSTWITREEAAADIDFWIHAGGFDDSNKPEFWAYYADYDWVVFCQLFGAMVDLPKGFPMFCRDLVQESKRLGLTDEMLATVPQIGTGHNALDDARTLKARHEWLICKLAREPERQRLLELERACLLHLGTRDPATIKDVAGELNRHRGLGRFAAGPGSDDRPSLGPNHVIYDGRIIALRDFLNAILPKELALDTAARPAVGPENYIFPGGDSRFGYRPVPTERLACERCGEQVSESYAPGRCFNDQGEPAEMASHDVAAPWSEVHGTKT